MTRTKRTSHMKKNPVRTHAIAIAVACLLVFTAGCVPSSSKKHDTGPIICDIFRAPTDEEIRSEGFASRVKRLTEQIKTTENSHIRASMHIRLTTLLMDHRNPGKDYVRAARELGYYLAVSGDIGCADTARNIHGILKQLKYSGSSSKTRQLTEKVNSLSQELEQCSESFATCNETLRRLQEIELQMEKKRRTIR